MFTGGKDSKWSLSFSFNSIRWTKEKIFFHPQWLHSALPKSNLSFSTSEMKSCSKTGSGVPGSPPHGQCIAMCCSHRTLPTHPCCGVLLYISLLWQQAPGASFSFVTDCLPESSFMWNHSAEWTRPLPPSNVIYKKGNDEASQDWRSTSISGNTIHCILFPEGNAIQRPNWANCSHTYIAGGDLWNTVIRKKKEENNLKINK